MGRQCRAGLLVRDVQALAHFLAGLEVGDALLRHFDSFASARIAALAAVAVARGEGAEAAQLDAAAGSQCLSDLVEEGVERALDIVEPQLGIFLCQRLQQLGPDHEAPSTKPPRTLSRPPFPPLLSCHLLNFFAMGDTSLA
ncbi:hypothetical protein NOVOSPHI9U_50399 [Novosphingobium sp. 9U]|nr:hypothetical protein NOVOSPHI9U_50399 [Novosphingobium sp. 9U]